MVDLLYHWAMWRSTSYCHFFEYVIVMEIFTKSKGQRSISIIWVNIGYWPKQQYWYFKFVWKSAQYGRTLSTGIVYLCLGVDLLPSTKKKHILSPSMLPYSCPASPWHILLYPYILCSDSLSHPSLSLRPDFSTRPYGDRWVAACSSAPETWLGKHHHSVCVCDVAYTFTCQGVY